MIERLGIDVQAILSSSTSSDTPAASWVQIKEIKPNSTESIDSLQAVHANEPECDEPASLLTDNSPELMISPDVELTERSVQLQAGIEKATKSGLQGETLEIVKKAVFVDGVDCFRAEIQENDPPADVPAMRVRLNPGQVPPHARPRSAAPEKDFFLMKFVDTLADAGMVVTALGAPFATSGMAVVKSCSTSAPKV